MLEKTGKGMQRPSEVPFEEHGEDKGRDGKQRACRNLKSTTSKEEGTEEEVRKDLLCT